ncbi:MAG: HIT domain-containing protein [Melioribacteraceae bacterium]|nr:HIT domain-containing protein [Melioribacteraceae bacterium]
MDRMWSPWRSQYIDSFKEENKDNTCVFCNAQTQNIDDDKCLVVYRDKLTFVILNLYPYNNGHLMIIPKRHISNFTDLSVEEHQEIMKNVDLTIKTMNKMMKPQGFNIGMNVGKAAGAGIDQHLHFHIVPRWIGDTNFMPVIGEVKIISHELIETKKNLIKAFKEVESEK